MKTFRIILLSLATLAAALYILFIIEILTDHINMGLSTGEILTQSEYYLFLLFAVAYALVWRNMLTSGISLVVWHIIQWCLVLFVWDDGEVTLILGFPIALIGILLIIYSSLKNRRMKSVN